MKKIVKSLVPQNQVLATELPEYPIIGIIRYNTKGWAQMTDYDSGKYAVFGVQSGSEESRPKASGVGAGNGWSDNGISLDGVLAMAHESFLFNTDRELFKWLAE